uniref:NACHT domain-containing protein n=2 Tax=Pyxicephalus adspersus TaxID=30357 RepID=A0AAV2ZV35_PYXAD|nr:TPA: hypothetical protein GDO54_015211 [Pyxicephalus adspersus]
MDSLFLVEGLTDAQLQEHDVVQLEFDQGRRSTLRRLPLEKLLTPLSRVSLPPRITLTVGVAGAGKSTLVRLFVEKWARGELCTDIPCLFTLNLWELNIFERLSAEKVIRIACPRYSVPPPNSLLILDGLDELRAPLDFSDSIASTDPQKELPPECLITNILRGNLLPDVLVWVTSRPGAAAMIPGGLVDRMTEISGLESAEIRQYMDQLLHDTNGLVDRICVHLESDRSLNALCSIPTLCHIIAMSLGFAVRAYESTYPCLPMTLSAIFSWYLKAQFTDLEGIEQPSSARRTVGNLGKLAFQGLLRRRTVFYESDLKSCGIDIPILPGSLCGRLLLPQTSPSCTSFYFSHLLVQEFLAAVHYYSAAKRAIFDLFAEGAVSWPKLGFLNHYKCATQRVLQTDGAQLSIFLRFLSGLLSSQVVRILTGCLPNKEEPSSHRGQNNNFKDDVMELLATILRAKDCAIQKISLSENQLGNRGVKVLGRALMVNSTLCSIDLHGNSIGPSGAKALAEVLKNNQVLQTLDLQNNQIKSEGVQYLAQSLLLNRKLMALNIQKNGIGWEGAESLAVSLKENQVLQELWLSSNTLGDQGASALAEALTKNLSLVTLDLKSNSISNQGLKSLTIGLSQNQSLKHLNLRENSISIEGARALAKALRTNTTLTHLDLTANLLHDEGVEAMSGALRENRSLDTLHLQWNFLRVGSARSLADALRVNKCLRCLDLQENAIGDEGVSALCKALQENSTLAALYLQGTTIGPSGAQALAETLLVNKGLTILE